MNKELCCVLVPQPEVREYLKAVAKRNGWDVHLNHPGWDLVYFRVGDDARPRVSSCAKDSYTAKESTVVTLDIFLARISKPAPLNLEQKAEKLWAILGAIGRGLEVVDEDNFIIKKSYWEEAVRRAYEACPGNVLQSK